MPPQVLTSGLKNPAGPINKVFASCEQVLITKSILNIVEPL